METKKVCIVKKATFHASHYHHGMLSEAEHTHDFMYEVKLCGMTNGEGFLVDFREMEKTLFTAVNKKIMYKTLNTAFDFPPTTENMCVWIYNQLKEVYKDLLFSVKLYETADSWVIYEGDK